MNIAIVGCGTIAPVHAKSIELLSGHQLVAVADCIYSRAEAMAAEYGAKAYATSSVDDLETMLKEEDIQVLHICTPHYLHVSMASMALKRGIHVFMEKPPIINWKQWDMLKEVVEEQKENATLGICFQNRFNPGIELIRNKLKNSELGNILAARGIVTWCRDEDYYSGGDWRGKWDTEGGGVLINQSIHTLDLLQYLVDKKPLSMEATMANHHLKGVIEVEDTMEAYVTYPEDVRVCFYATNGYKGNVPPLIELECEKARVRIEELEVTAFYTDGEVERWTVPRGEQLGKSYWGAGHTDCIHSFYKSLESQTPFQIQLKDIEHTIWLMLTAYDTAGRGNVYHV